MTEHDRIRKERALNCDRNDLDSVADAVRGLQSTDDPSLLPLHDELMKHYMEMQGKRQYYELNPIDGPLFREQRLFLLELQDTMTHDFEKERLQGLINLLDEIADQAHDKYGLDCLLTEDKE